MLSCFLESDASFALHASLKKGTTINHVVYSSIHEFSDSFINFNQIENMVSLIPSCMRSLVILSIIRIIITKLPTLTQTHHHSFILFRKINQERVPVPYTGPSKNEQKKDSIELWLYVVSK